MEAQSDSFTQNRTSTPSVFAPGNTLASSHILRKHGWLLAVCGVFVLALGLRLYNLDTYNLWYDEIQSIEAAQRGVDRILNACAGWMCNQTPGHFLLTWLTLQPADVTLTTFWVRLPSVLAGALAPVVTFGLGRELFGRWQGMLAAIMVACAPALLNHSQEVRPYALLVFLPALSVYCLLVAQRTRSAGWWIAFGLSTLAATGNSYHAVMFFMPPLILYMLYITWSLWRGRSTESRGEQAARDSRPLIYATLATATIVVATVLAMSGILQVARDSSGISGVTLVSGLSASVSTTVELAGWLAQLGIGGQAERLLSLGLLLLALLGIYGAYRSGHKRGAALCALFFIFPPVALALLSTVSVVFQRYALSAMPFYFLLVAEGLVFTWGAASSTEKPRSKALRVVPALAAGLIAALFAYGAAYYSTPEGHSKLSYRVDFRGVAAYLAGHATPDDIILFVDDPDLGYTSSLFYWGNNPPAPAFDARDPRVFSRSAKDVYWVVSTDNPEAMGRLEEELRADAQDWTAVVSFERALVLRESAGQRSITEVMARMLDRLDAARPNYAPYALLRGCIYQAQGLYEQAARSYRQAGTYFALGDEYLRVSRTYEAENRQIESWREATQAKFVQPDMPEVHAWLAQKLTADGYEAESRAERRIEQLLNGTNR